VSWSAELIFVAVTVSDAKTDAGRSESIMTSASSTDRIRRPVLLFIIEPPV